MGTLLQLEENIFIINRFVSNVDIVYKCLLTDICHQSKFLNPFLKIFVRSAPNLLSSNCYNKLTENTYIEYTNNVTAAGYCPGLIDAIRSDKLTTPYTLDPKNPSKVDEHSLRCILESLNGVYLSNNPLVVIVQVVQKK